LCLEIYRAVRAADLIRSETLQYRLTPLALAVTKTYGVGGLKIAMGMAGLTGGAVRAPLSIPGETAIAEIAELLKQAQRALDQNSSGAATGVAPGSSLVHQGVDG
jgi:dihydrodipicolinate synthase/N-acetylneuraminate lyase